MSPRDKSREARPTGAAPTRDLGFAGTVAAGLVASVLGIGAMSAPLLDWTSTDRDTGSAPTAGPIVMAAPGAVADESQSSPASRPAPGETFVAPGGTVLVSTGPGDGVTVPAATSGGGRTILVSAPGAPGGPAPAPGGGSSGGQQAASLDGVLGRGERDGVNFGGRRFAPMDDLDSDVDGLSDRWERRYGFDPFDPTDNLDDADGDGMPNATEYWTHQKPRSKDSNGDGIEDGDDDSDNDGIRNAVEVKTGSKAWEKDSDDDGIPDGQNDPDRDGIPSVDEERTGSDPSTPNPVILPPEVEPPAPPAPPAPPSGEEGPIAVEPDPVDVEDPSDDAGDGGDGPDAPAQPEPAPKAPAADPEP
jgi:hypothetical protein